MFSKPVNIDRDEQLKAVADLVYNPGYLALMDFLQADLDNLADRMAMTLDSKELLSLTRRWQARRDHLLILKTQPAQLAIVVDREKEVNKQFNEYLTPVPEPTIS